MHKMRELKEKLTEELNKYASKPDLSASSLEVIDKLTHSIKSIDTILAMEESGYSNDYAYARGRGRYAKRDSMGRYSNGMYYDGYDDGMEHGGMRGYSRANAKENLVNELRDIMDDTHDEEVKRMVHSWIKQVEG